MIETAEKEARTDLKPWERQEDEGAKAYEAFVIYREMGPERSLTKVSEELHKGRDLIGRWSATYHWVDRVREYERQLEGEQLDTEVRARKEMEKRHLDQSIKMQEICQETLDAVKTIQPKDVPAWLKLAQEIELRCRGIAAQGDLSIGIEIEVTQENVLLVRRLYPKVLSMLTEGQVAELEEYRRQLFEDARDDLKEKTS